MSSNAKPVVLSVSEWSTTKTKYMPPKVSDRGSKSINIISTQTNRALTITTPMLMTWGVTDFIGENGESQGKYGISFNFPNEEYSKPSTDAFLEKMKEFENQILDDAVKNSELWWGKKMSRELCQYTFFPMLKYSKNKETQQIDYNRPPSINAKVPFYANTGKWGVEIYNTKDQLIFPCEDENLTPIDFLPKFSQMACVLQCGGVWTGGKGWGVTWKLIQCVVKPREVVSIYGKCHIQLSDEDRDTIDTQPPPKDADAEVEDTVVTKVSKPKPVPVVQDTSAADSDEEPEAESVVDEPELESVEEPEPEPEPVVQTPAPVKKVVKKAVSTPAPVEEEVVDTDVAVAVEPAKKKVIKKKVVA